MKAHIFNIDGEEVAEATARSSMTPLSVLRSAAKENRAGVASCFTEPAYMDLILSDRGGISGDSVFAMDMPDGGVMMLDIHEKLESQLMNPLPREARFVVNIAPEGHSIPDSGQRISLDPPVLPETPPRPRLKEPTERRSYPGQFL